MSQSISVMLLGGLIRMMQGFAAAAPTLLVGLFIAAILRYYLGEKGTLRLFGGDSIRSLPQSWLIGMLLPVCSIGVLPILREMRRAGVKPGAMSAFALSAPLFNPLSLLYGLTLSRPIVIILFAIGSLVVVTVLGAGWDFLAERRGTSRRLVDGKNEPAASDSPLVLPDHLIGMRRLLATFVHFARELTGVSLGLALIALSGLAILAAMLPYGAMQNSVEQGDPWAPLTMLWVAIPVYATPMLAMSQLGMMFQHANSPGAAFTLLILGAGMNVATPLWFGKHFGFKSACVWLVSLLVVVMGISYAINRPLIPPGVEPAGHTHAFDIYANPLSAYHSISLATVKEIGGKNLGISEYVSLGMLGLIALVGIALRMFGINEATLVRTASAGSFASSLVTEQVVTRRGMDRVVPPSVIGLTMLIGLIATSLVACYAYYPSANECLDEISMARSECLSAANSGQTEAALFWLPVWEDWSRRMEVGTFLRSGEIRPYQRMQGYLIRKKLELLEHELEHDPPEPEEVKAVVKGILVTNSRWVRSFRTPQSRD